MLDNHKKIVFQLKTAFLGESQRVEGGFPIKFQGLGWRHIKVFFTCVQLTFMLFYRIHSILDK